MMGRRQRKHDLRRRDQRQQQHFCDQGGMVMLTLFGTSTAAGYMNVKCGHVDLLAPVRPGGVEAWEEVMLVVVRFDLPRQLAKNALTAGLGSVHN